MMNESNPESGTNGLTPIAASGAGPGLPLSFNPAPAAQGKGDNQSAVASMLPQLEPPFQPVDYASTGFHLDLKVTPDQVVAAAAQLDQAGFSLDTITGVDWMAESQMEVVYDFFHPTQTLRAVVRTRIPRDQPELPTISVVFPGANWHERETHDFFGIRFLGHPDLSPFLLPEDATFHPLKKDFTA
jgi:NADH-quinone oxidoreductase subunit C